jgi:hypothetical protein
MTKRQQALYHYLASVMEDQPIPTDICSLLLMFHDDIAAACEELGRRKSIEPGPFQSFAEGYGIRKPKSPVDWT